MRSRRFYLQAWLIFLKKNGRPLGKDGFAASAAAGVVGYHVFMESFIASSKRLGLRAFTPQDAAVFYELSQDHSFSSFLITDYRQASEETARAWIRRASELLERQGVGKWAVVLRETGGVIGLGGLSPWEWDGEALVDITYRLHSRAVGKGFGRELAELLLGHARARGISNLSATITPDNFASIRLAESLGFVFRKQIELHGVVTSLYVMQQPRAQGGG